LWLLLLGWGMEQWQHPSRQPSWRSSDVLCISQRNLVDWLWRHHTKCSWIPTSRIQQIWSLLLGRKGQQPKCREYIRE
jgi:hypothetical protein